MESKLVLEKRKQIDDNLEFVKQAMFAREVDSVNEYSAVVRLLIYLSVLNKTPVIE